MDELPELPFEQVLSYLNLKDRLKARTVSRAWRNKLDNYPVKTLCFSERPIERILGRSRWISGAFVQNFINSTRFATFFDIFGQTILSTLKHLRLCDLDLCENETAFTSTLNEFSQLEQLDIIRARFNQQDVFLNLPMLTSFHLENARGIEKLTLEASRLREVTILNCSSNLSVEIVHGESVERLLVYCLEYTEVKKLKNLQFLYAYHLPRADSTFLASLQQLKEIHLQSNKSISKLFEQKRRYNRADLKIYLCGLLLNGPDDPAMYALTRSPFGPATTDSLGCLAENQWRLANEIPFYSSLYYSAIEGVVAPGIEVGLLKRFIRLNEIKAYMPVQDIERFLDLLKNFQHISSLEFRGAQPQDLYDRLPEHSTVQKFFIDLPPSDLAFLFRLKQLIRLDMNWRIDIETVRRAFDELPLPLLSSFWFKYKYMMVSIEIDQLKQFKVSVDGKEKTIVFDLNAAIKLI